MLDYQQKLLLYNEFIHTKTISAYKNRNFAKAYKTPQSYALQSFQHIKRPHKAQYIVFDIDKIDINVFNNVFYNNFSLLPNAYICEFSQLKQCYTLQLFYKTNAKIDDDFIKVYKKLCQFFGADLKYQLKTGIHKNFISENLQYIEQIDNQKLLKTNYIAYIHSETISARKFSDIVSILELFNELPTQSPTLSVKTRQTPEKRQANTIAETSATVGNRNIFLFDKVRFFAYETNNKTLANISDYANRINSKLAQPLPVAEVKATARSVYKYVNGIDKTTTKQAHAIFTAEQAEKGRQSQQLQALRTITRAILQLKKTGKNITFSAIKKITKQNINTIKKYIDIVLNEMKKADQLPPDFAINSIIVKNNSNKKNVVEAKLQQQKPPI